MFLPKKPQSIRKSLITGFVSVAFFAVLLTIIPIAMNENSRQKKDGIKYLSTLAEVIGWSSSAALVFLITT